MKLQAAQNTAFCSVATFFEKTIRHLLPRWRRSAATVMSGEVATDPSLRRRPDRHPQNLRPRLEEWRRDPNLYAAAELVSEAAVTGYRDELIEAAADMVARSDLPDFTRQVAAAVSNADSRAGRVASTLAVTQDSLRQQIRRLKRLLAADARDALAWTDLALAYTSLGQRERAKVSVRNALLVARENRVVIRAAVRFWVHLRDPEAALYVLRSSRSALGDPWLLAAEIAVAPLIGQAPAFMKAGVRILDAGRFGELQVSELAAALASIELAAGNVKRARKFFRRALQSPTENVVAQATWAEFAAGLGVLNEEHLLAPYSYEARARDAAHVGDWERAMTESGTWLSDQPFSVAAAAFASYTASVGLMNYSVGSEFARVGLIANPRNTLLLNNLAFCLASADAPDAAAGILAGIARSEIEDDGVLLATSGLIEFRRGNIDAGRTLYMRALALFRRYQLPKSEALAAIYLAREEQIAHTSEAQPALHAAMTLAKSREEPEVLQSLQHVIRVAGPEATLPGD